MMHSNTKDYWPAVGALTLGLAGQTVIVTSLFAMVISLFISYLTRGFDRRYVLLGLSLFF